MDHLVLVDGDVVRKKVFVSFDYDHDRGLKEFIIGQSILEDSPFDIADLSLKVAAPMNKWEAHARKSIMNADVVLVIVGHYTYKASGVVREVELAREAGKRIIQLIGHKGSSPSPVPKAGRLYRWTWSNLKRLLG